MNKMPFVRGVFNASSIVFRVMSILSLIGGICLLLSIFGLSVLPANFLSVKIESDSVVDLNLSCVYGESWKEAMEETPTPEEFEETDSGYRYVLSEAETVENRGFALALVPVLAEMLTMFLFYRCLANATASVKDAPPQGLFTPVLAKEVKLAGIVMFFLAVGPALCSGLITALTAGKQSYSLGSTEIEFTLVIWGFVLLALSYLFEYGASLQPAFQGQQTENDFRNPPADGSF